jgi:hypothetical protein
MLVQSTFGDYYFTPAGLLLTLLGTLLAALKTLFTHVLQSPPNPTFSDPLALLSVLSPLALLHCTILAQATGELARVAAYSRQLSCLGVGALILNGALAFGLNTVSFRANRRVGALGMTVAGSSALYAVLAVADVFCVANVKQVLTVACAVVVFELRISALNALGIALTLLGGAWYACVELGERR